MFLRSRAGSVAFALAIGVTVAGLLPGLTAVAAAAVTCPTVNQSTGAVTPTPAPGVDWSGCDLDNAIMSGADLAGANLSGASITGESRQEILTDANLTGANLSDAVLAGADMTGADLSNADLTNASLFDAVLGQARIGGAIFTGANVTNLESGSGGITGTPVGLAAGWELTGGFLIGPTAYLVSADLHGLDLSGADLASATLDSANLTGTNLTGANLGGANLDYSDLTSADLTNANAAGAYLEVVDFTDANLTNTDLTGATLQSDTSGGIVGSPASLPTHWIVAAGYLIGPDDVLKNANLAGANLTGADIALSNLTGANLAGADLSGANATSAVLTGVNLSSANLGTATLNSVVSGSITGTPAALPPNWIVVAGYLVGPRSDLATADLAGLDLAGVDIFGSLLNSANFTGTNLSGATITSSSLVNTNLTDADLSGANLTGSFLRGTNVSGAVLASATLTGVRSNSITTIPASLPPGWQLVSGYLAGPGAVLQLAQLQRADLAGADLAGADLRDANLQGADLANANLSNADVNFAALQGANLTGAAVTGATFTSAHWLSTICPDGTNSNKYVDGCFSALDTTPPIAAPAVASGTAGTNGWYTSDVTVDWNWTDDGTVATANCEQQSDTFPATGAITLTATCADLAGNVGQAQFTVKVDTTDPVVAVTGVANGARYAIGRVPAAGCSTNDHVSGVAAEATARISHRGLAGLGSFTVTCAGAISVAGTTQAAPVTATYSVGYGLSGFIGLHAGSRIIAPAHRFTVRFRLMGANGKPLPARTAAELAARHAVEVRLTGPFIRAVTAVCRWDRTAGDFACAVRVPTGARPDVRGYELTARENVGAGFMVAPATASENPLPVRFQFRR